MSSLDDSFVGISGDQGPFASRPDRGSLLALPALSLPKGGGEIRVIDEKFCDNPLTAAASVCVSHQVSPGRSGFGPQLALSRDSRSRNRPFGFGWSLAMAAISRKTDRRLPRSEDVGDSDTCLVSGAEDLGGAYLRTDDGGWITDAEGSSFSTRAAKPDPRKRSTCARGALTSCQVDEAVLAGLIKLPLN